MHNDHSVAAHWPGGFDEAELRVWAEKLRARLKAPRVDLGLVFLSPKFFGVAASILELLRVHAQGPLLAGCSSTSLIAGSEEAEYQPGLAPGLCVLAGASLAAGV